MNLEGYNTLSKKLIIGLLSENPERSFSADEIVRYIEEQGHSVHPSTVYRCLGKLASAGEILVYAAEDRKNSTYQISECSLCSEHLHIKCSVCGRIIHLDCGFMEEMKEHLMEKHGFRLNCGGSILYGLCEDCRKQSGCTEEVHKSCTCGHHHESHGDN